MGLSTYFVTVETRAVIDLQRYDTVAAQLLHELRQTLGDASNLRMLTHINEFSEAVVETEITLSPKGHVLAQTLVQVESPSKLRFDKNRFTQLLRARLPDQITVTKRALTKDDVAALPFAHP